MRDTRLIMGMPITVEVLDQTATPKTLRDTFDYFAAIDERFSPYKQTSELTRMNSGWLPPTDYSDDMRVILALADETKLQTNGYFDIGVQGAMDPSGIVKGWAIQQAARRLLAQGFKNFYVEAGGDIQAHGHNKAGKSWQIGIRNPFNRNEIVKVIHVTDRGVATSGTYERGEHIYDPKNQRKPVGEIVSLTVIGPDVFEADRFATAAFAMGKAGIQFIEQLPGFEAYMIDEHGIATQTSHFNDFIATPDERH